MRSYLILFLLLFVSLASFEQQAQDSPSIALIKQAVDVMDKGDPDKAIRLLDSARRSSNIPDFRYDYETGFAYQLKKDYNNAIRFFEASTKYDNSTDQSYE